MACEARAEKMQPSILPLPHMESQPVADQSSQISASFCLDKNATPVSISDSDAALTKKGPNSSSNETTSPPSSIPLTTTGVNYAASNEIPGESQPVHLQQERQSTAQLALTQPFSTPPSLLDNDPSKLMARETSGKLYASNTQNELSPFQSQSKLLN